MRALRFIRRTKLAHVLFWTLSWRSMVHTLLQYSPETSLQVIQHSTTITMLFQMLMVYGIVYGLLPRLFRPRRHGLFVLAALGVVIATSVGAVFFKEHWMRWMVDPDYHLHRTMVILSNLMDGLVLAFIWTVIYIAEHLFLKDRRHAVVERQRLQAELEFLRSQLNPHFLFNTLNSIHVIMRHDRSQAERMLLEFSGLLRYQLYECNGADTTLEKEVEFIRNYIALERWRHGADLEVAFHAPTVVPYRTLAPFILIPFVENAFKHVSRSTDRPNHVHIRLGCTHGQVHLRVENTCDAPTAPDERKGIGLANTRRRLALLYPDRHQLDIASDGRTFTVHLMIQP